MLTFPAGNDVYEDYYFGSYNPTEFQGNHGDMDTLTTLKNHRMCAALLQPRSGDYRRRYFGGVPLPPSVEDDLSSIKVLAVCAHLRNCKDVATKRYECGVLLRALGSYAKHRDVSVIMGGDFNITKEEISEIVYGLDDELQSRISLKFPPSPLLGCRAGLERNIDGFIMITARSGMGSCLGGSFCADGEAKMVPLDQYLDAITGNRHFLFDHEPVFLKYRLELDRSWVLQQLEDARKNTEQILALERKLQEHKEMVEKLLLLQNYSSGPAHTERAINCGQAGGTVPHSNNVSSPAHIEQTDAAQNQAGADLQGTQPVTDEENNMQKRAPPAHDQEVANDEDSRRKQQCMGSNDDEAGPSRPYHKNRFIIDDSDDEDGPSDVGHPQMPPLQAGMESREVECGGTKALWVLKRLQGNREYDYEAENNFWVTSGPVARRYPCIGRHVEISSERASSKDYKKSFKIRNGSGREISLGEYIRTNRIRLLERSASRSRGGAGQAVAASAEAVSALKIRLRRALVEVGFSEPSANSLLNSEGFRPRGRIGHPTLVDWTLIMPDGTRVRSVPEIGRYTGLTTLGAPSQQQQQLQPPSTD